MRYQVLARRDFHPKTSEATAMLERRQKERRSWGPPPQYPFVDSQNMLVRSDRRHRPDRRLNNILSKWEQSRRQDDSGRLFLQVQYQPEPIEMGAKSLFIGRHRLCDIRIGNKFASRVHAYLERDGEGVHLVDKSSNGTYLCTQAGKRIRLLRTRLLLEGSGLISLGTAVRPNDKWVIRYRCA